MVRLPVRQVDGLCYATTGVDDHDESHCPRAVVELTEWRHRRRLDYSRIQSQHDVGKEARKKGIDGVRHHNGLRHLAVSLNRRSFWRVSLI